MARKVKRSPFERRPTFIVVEYIVGYEGVMAQFTRVSNSTVSVVWNNKDGDVVMPQWHHVRFAHYMHRPAPLLFWVPRDLVSSRLGVNKRGRARLKVLEEYAPARRQELPIWPSR